MSNELELHLSETDLAANLVARDFSSTVGTSAIDASLPRSQKDNSLFDVFFTPVIGIAILGNIFHALKRKFQVANLQAERKLSQAEELTQRQAVGSRSVVVPTPPSGSSKEARAVNVATTRMLEQTVNKAINQAVQSAAKVKAERAKDKPSFIPPKSRL